MARVALEGGFYKAKSVIAAVQRCVNLYPEFAPESAQAPVPVTHYLTPGLVLKLTLFGAPVRQLYRASDGQLYAVAGDRVYYLDSHLSAAEIGRIGTSTGTPYFADNGLVVVLVDGSSVGCAIDPVTHDFDAIHSVAFFGATRCDYVDTYFLFNRPGTAQWYISLSEANYDMLVNSPIGSGTISANGTAYTSGTYHNVPLTGGSGTGATAETIEVSGGQVVGVTLGDGGTLYNVGDSLSAAAASIGGTGSGFTWDVLTAGAFDPLDIAAKVGYPDRIATLIVMHREVWLIGELTTEIWYNSGASDFTFQQMPGSFIEHGCVAPYSIAKEDLSIFWLSQDLQGQALVIQGTNYQAKRISTHAIENEISKYVVVSDAIGFTYQQEGHVFYQLTFPSANKTWVYDVATSLWHERVWTDADGNENRHRANCSAFAYGLNLVGDWENGNLYVLDPETYTDFGGPIVRIRGFPHIVNDGKRIFHRQMILDMEVGSAPGLLASTPPQVSLRWSDTRGASWGTPVMMSVGATGQYLTSMQVQRLGMARDRVYEVSWSMPYRTALQGAWLDTTVAGT